MTEWGCVRLGIVRVAYHRLAHDLHHRGAVLDYLGQLGISLEV